MVKGETVLEILLGCPGMISQLSAYSLGSLRRTSKKFRPLCTKAAQVAYKSDMEAFILPQLPPHVDILVKIADERWSVLFSTLRQELIPPQVQAGPNNAQHAYLHQPAGASASTEQAAGSTLGCHNLTALFDRMVLGPCERDAFRHAVTTWQALLDLPRDVNTCAFLNDNDSVFKIIRSIVTNQSRGHRHEALALLRRLLADDVVGVSRWSGTMKEIYNLACEEYEAVRTKEWNLPWSKAHLMQIGTYELHTSLLLSVVHATTVAPCAANEDPPYAFETVMQFLVAAGNCFIPPIGNALRAVVLVDNGTPQAVLARIDNWINVDTCILHIREDKNSDASGDLHYDLHLFPHFVAALNIRRDFFPGAVTASVAECVYLFPSRPDGTGVVSEQRYHRLREAHFETLTNYILRRMWATASHYLPTPAKEGLRYMMHMSLGNLTGGVYNYSDPEMREMEGSQGGVAAAVAGLPIPHASLAALTDR
ncbi:hypothetical protein WJX84_007846 [Apatococcus fuscideae]|uniref:Uncharacterized protein n=1 Tax=Apatococcus fuscideae TaxID=2026836 RepID=A0AAW1SQG7_9CHLO